MTSAVVLAASALPGRPVHRRDFVTCLADRTGQRGPFGYRAKWIDPTLLHDLRSVGGREAIIALNDVPGRHAQSSRSSFSGTFRAARRAPGASR